MNGSNPHNKRFFVEGYGKDWYVCSRNNTTVARCTSKKWANKIAKLLIEDAYEAETEAMKATNASRICGPANPCYRTLCQRCNPQGIHARRD